MARYIDADKLIQALCNTQKTWGSRLGTSWWSHSVKLKDNMVRCIKEQPTADVEEVVRCKNCAYRYTKNCNAKHERADMDFCSSGIR